MPVQAPAALAFVFAEPAALVPFAVQAFAFVEPVVLAPFVALASPSGAALAVPASSFVVVDSVVDSYSNVTI